MRCRFYIETYGCRMNICDSEIIVSILEQSGYSHTDNIADADIIIFNSCSVREVGHSKVFERLNALQKSANSPLLVIAGCFATLLDRSVLDKYPDIDLVVNPNDYRLLPKLIEYAFVGQRHFISHTNVEDELYEDIIPVRCFEDKTTAAITIMKGCEQYCSYCIEPFTRGREHSRSIVSILSEVKKIVSEGYREITLVGHIIDKYESTDPSDGSPIDFARLLGIVAESAPQQRIKFLSSHPVTFTDDIVRVIKTHNNIMRVVHLPLQSGSDAVLQRMNRGYTVEDYKSCMERVRSAIPDISIITDIMVGFCSESDDDFRKTLDAVSSFRFNDVNVFEFSMRSGTVAHKRYADDIPLSEKQRRSAVVKSLRDNIKRELHRQLIGNTETIIVERVSEDRTLFFGRDMYHRTVALPTKEGIRINDSVMVRIINADSRILNGDIV